jgi:hypothetical protein
MLPIVRPSALFHTIAKVRPTCRQRARIVQIRGERALWALVLVVGMVAIPAPHARAVTDADLALHWAPVHYQDTDNTDADADYLSPVDYDGDWNTLNNWENQDDDVRRLTGTVYYSVVETSTHWFIVYAFYHPRDWCDSLGCQALDQHHENDMEGAMLTVRKSGPMGRLEAMVTVAHRDFRSYVPPGSTFANGQEDVDGTIRTVALLGNDARPTTFQEAKGHGLYAWDGEGFPGGDGVVYRPAADSSQVPASGNDRAVNYRMVNIFAPGELWARRANAETFAAFGVFRGDNGADNAANAAWRWDDHDDGPQLQGGELATDPAELVAIYFSNLGEFSRTYARNGYRP